MPFSHTMRRSKCNAALKMAGPSVPSFRPICRNCRNPPFLFSLESAGRLDNEKRSIPVHDLLENSFFCGGVAPVCA